MIIIGNKDNIKFTKKMLARNFDIKDMGLADVILVIKIAKRYSLDQSHYVEKILEKFDKGSNVIARTPVEVVSSLHKNYGEGVRQLEYSRA